MALRGRGRVEAREGRREREGRRGKEGDGRGRGGKSEVRNRGRQISTSAESTLIMGQKNNRSFRQCQCGNTLCTSTVVD